MEQAADRCSFSLYLVPLDSPPLPLLLRSFDVSSSFFGCFLAAARVRPSIRSVRPGPPNKRSEADRVCSRAGQPVGREKEKKSLDHNGPERFIRIQQRRFRRKRIFYFIYSFIKKTRN